MLLFSPLGPSARDQAPTHKVADDDFTGIAHLVTPDEPVIVVCGRVGGGNREDYRPYIRRAQKHPRYLGDHDGTDDCTHAYFYYHCRDLPDDAPELVYPDDSTELCAWVDNY